MKILQVNCVYKKGSTGKIVADIHSELMMRGEQSIVCFGRGQREKEQDVYKTCGELYSKWNNVLSRITGLIYGGCFFSTRKLISVIKKEQPSVVHLHCINGYFVNIYKLISWLKNKKIKVLLTLHAEFMYTGNCGHAFDCEKWKNGCGHCSVFRKETGSFFVDRTHVSWKKMKKAFDGFDELYVSSVSPWLMSRAVQSPILKDKRHEVVLNGLDTAIFCYRPMKKLEENIVLHVTPDFNAKEDSLKGGRYVIELAKRMPSVQFIVVGRYAKEVNVPSNIQLLGEIRNQECLSEYYRKATVTLLTSARETFSMVLAESLCCGTPVVGFKAGAPEQICIKEYCAFAEYGDIDQLQCLLERFLTRNPERYKIAELAKEKYDKKKMVEKYVTLYKKIVGGGV